MNSNAGNTPDYDQVAIALQKLKEPITKPPTLSKLNEIKDRLAEFRKELNKISLDLSISITEKIEFYFTLTDDLMVLPNKYQMIFSRVENRELYTHNLVELKIVNQFIMWAIVSNSKDLHQFHTQISANLLSKILEIETFQYESDYVTLTDQDSLDNFAKMFNYHQTSAGLFSSALVHLSQYHIDDARSWANHVFFHIMRIYKLLNNLDFNELFRLTQLDPNRNFYTICTIFVYPALDFIKFIKMIYQLFGTNWSQELVIEDQTFTMMSKIEFMQHLSDFFENMRKTILNMNVGHRDLDNNADWQQFLSLLTVLKSNVVLVETYDNVVHRKQEIDKEKINTIITTIQSLTQLQEELHQENSSLNYYILDALEKLIIIVMNSSTTTSYRRSILEIIPSYLDKISHVRNHGLLLIYSIYNYNIIKHQETETDVEELLQFISKYLDLVLVDTLDSIMLRILSVLIAAETEYYDNLKVIDALYKIKNESLNRHVGVTKHIEDYLQFLIDSYQGRTTEHLDIMDINCNWDWRCWLIPDLNDDTPKYKPINITANRVVK